MNPIIIFLLAMFGLIILFGAFFMLGFQCYNLGRKHGYDDCIEDMDSLDPDYD